MVLGTKNDWLDFSPNFIEENTNFNAIFILIERAIIEGSGGPDNVPITKAGLRLVRHILSLTSENNCLPNFKNMDTIKRLSQLFMDSCDDKAQALQIMQTIMQSPADDAAFSDRR